MYSLHLFLISSMSTRSLPFLSFILHIFWQNAPLMSHIFLKRSLACSLLSFLLLLNIVHWRRSTFPSLPFFSLFVVLLLFVKALQIITLHSCFYFSLRWFCLPPPILYHGPLHSSSGILLIRSSPLNLLITFTANSYGIRFKSYLTGLSLFLVSYSLNLN